jgi:hypothetical protein
METTLTTVVTQFEQKALTVLEKAKGIIVTNAESYAFAVEFFKGLKSYQKELDQTFDPAIKKAHEAHKEMVAAKKRHALPIEQAEALVEQKCITWKREEDRKAEEKRRELEAEAKKQAEEAQIAAAEEAQNAGDVQQAEAIISEPVYVPPVVMPKAAPKVAGAAAVKYYGATITSLEDLVKAVAAGKAPIEAICANSTFLNGQARLKKKEGPLYPGVVVTCREGLAGR